MRYSKQKEIDVTISMLNFSRRKGETPDRRANRAEKDYAWAYDELKCLDWAMKKRFRGVFIGSYPENKALEKTLDSHRRGDWSHGLSNGRSDSTAICRVSRGNKIMALDD